MVAIYKTYYRLRHARIFFFFFFLRTNLYHNLKKLCIGNLVFDHILTFFTTSCDVTLLQEGLSFESLDFTTSFRLLCIDIF